MIKHGFPSGPAPVQKTSRTEALVRGVLFIAACVSAGVVLSIFGFLLYFSWPLLTGDRLGLLLGWHWRPFQGQFGILPMAVGSFALGTSALVLAYPLGVGVCCFAHGLGPAPAGRAIMVLVRFMTSIPTVVYGFVSVFILVPLIRNCFHHGSGYSWLAASLALSILVLPTIVLLVDGSFRKIEPEVRLTAAAIGLDQTRKIVHLVLPMSSPGLLAAAVLGFGRAVGDTIIPLMLAGNSPLIPGSIFDSIRTLTAHAALVVATDSQSTAYHSLFACGLLLFGLTVAVNLILNLIRARTGDPGGRHE